MIDIIVLRKRRALVGRIFKRIWPVSGRRKFVGICSACLAGGLVLLSCWGSALVIADEPDTTSAAAKPGPDKSTSVLVGGISSKSTTGASKASKEPAGVVPAPTKPKNTSKTAATGTAPLAPATPLSPVPGDIISCPQGKSCSGVSCPGVPGHNGGGG